MGIEAKIDAVASAVEEFKKLNDDRLKALESKGYAPADLTEKVEKANKEIDRLSSELKAAQAAINRSGQYDEKKGLSQKDMQYKAAFNKFLRSGDDTEVKALSVGSDPDGGYLVSPEMSSEIVKKVFESSPVRQLASVQVISSDTFEIIQDQDEMAASWVGETGSRAATSTAQLKKLIVPVHEMYAFPQATQKIIDDAQVNLEAWISEKVADKFGRTEATAFVSGDGVNKPMGFLSYAAGTSYGQIEQVASGDANNITADGLIMVSYALKAAYKPGAAWMMKRSSVAEVRKLKDTQGQYLWQPSLQVGQPDILLGFPIYEADDMPAEAANALAVAFGNFKAGYQIVDRFGIRVLRDPFTAKPYVGFYTTKRVGGSVKNFEAIKLLKVSA